MKSKRKAKQTKSWRVTYRWLAVGTAVIYTAVGGRTVNTAAAQQLPEAPGSDKGQTTSRTLQFNIAQGTLETILPAFENASQLHVIAPDTNMLTLSSPGVSGTLQPERALEQILWGTGLTYRFTGDKTVTLELIPVATSVDVTSNPIW